MRGSVVLGRRAQRRTPARPSASGGRVDRDRRRPSVVAARERRRRASDAGDVRAAAVGVAGGRAARAALGAESSPPRDEDDAAPRRRRSERRPAATTAATATALRRRRRSVRYGGQRSAMQRPSATGRAGGARCTGRRWAAGFVEQLLERLDLEQEQAQVEQHVDDLGAGDEITAPETLERLVDTWVSSCWFMPRPPWLTTYRLPVSFLDHLCCVTVATGCLVPRR